MHELLKPERAVSSNFHAEIAVGFDYELRKLMPGSGTHKTNSVFKKETDVITASTIN